MPLNNPGSRALTGTSGASAFTLTLAIGASVQDVPVTFYTPMPDTNYAAVVDLDASANVLGKATASILSKTPTGVVVRITNTGLVALGGVANVAVDAYRLS